MRSDLKTFLKWKSKFYLGEKLKIRFDIKVENFI